MTNVAKKKLKIYLGIKKMWPYQGVRNIRISEYFPIQIFVRIIFVLFFGYEYIGVLVCIIFLYEYIRIFVRIIFLIQIYLDIHSYYFFDTNIFGYLFVSFFGHKYIRIFTCIKNLYSSHPGRDPTFGHFINPTEM